MDEQLTIATLTIIGMVMTGVGAVIYAIIFDDHDKNRQIKEAQERLDLEEYRFRQDGIDRRNLQQ